MSHSRMKSYLQEHSYFCTSGSFNFLVRMFHEQLMKIQVYETYLYLSCNINSSHELFLMIFFSFIGKQHFLINPKCSFSDDFFPFCDLRHKVLLTYFFSMCCAMSLFVNKICWLILTLPSHKKIWFTKLHKHCHVTCT